MDLKDTVTADDEKQPAQNISDMCIDYIYQNVDGRKNGHVALLEWCRKHRSRVDSMMSISYSDVEQNNIESYIQKKVLEIVCTFLIDVTIGYTHQIQPMSAPTGRVFNMQAEHEEGDEHKVFAVKGHGITAMQVKSNYTHSLSVGENTKPTSFKEICSIATNIASDICRQLYSSVFFDFSDSNTTTRPTINNIRELLRHSNRSSLYDREVKYNTILINCNSVENINGEIGGAIGADMYSVNSPEFENVKIIASEKYVPVDAVMAFHVCDTAERTTLISGSTYCPYQLNFVIGTNSITLTPDLSVTARFGHMNFDQSFYSVKFKQWDLI